MSGEDLDITGRVRVLEHSVHKLDQRLENGLTTLEKQLGRVVETLSNHRQPIPFKEIAATVAVCLGIIAYVGSFLESQHAKNISLIEYRLKQVEQTTANMKMITVVPNPLSR